MATASATRATVVVLVCLSVVLGGLLTIGSVAPLAPGPNGPERIYTRYNRHLFGFHSVINVDSEPQARPIPTFRLGSGATAPSIHGLTPNRTRSFSVVNLLNADSNVSKARRRLDLET